ncbi:unnamed protein product [Sphagnum jensenii]|uniref:Uncharacterized protein n=1 Tax=Sphagnum jensenii TaxID=128206 RepID=A0ABP1AQK1_9BRYO
MFTFVRRPTASSTSPPARFFQDPLSRASSRISDRENCGFVFAKQSFFTQKMDVVLWLSATPCRVGKRASGRLVACAGGGGASSADDDGDEAAAAPPEVDLSVMSFTLGIPGFDDSELPRLLGILFGSCIVLNHVLSSPGGLISDAQLRSEMVGMVLCAVTIALPYIGRQLNGGGESTNSSNKGVGQSSMFAFADSITDKQKQELAWGSYALLCNTKTSAVLVWQDGYVVCARGSWGATSDGAMALALLGSKLKNTPVLQMSNALYIPNGADAKGWEVVPKGATCLFIQPVVEPNENNQTIASTGLIVISNFPHAFSSKDRLWFALLAKKISQSLTI